MSTAAYSLLQLMEPKLELKYLRLEKSRNRLLDELEGFEDELLNKPSPNGKWSINQIVSHLIQVEQLTINYMQHKSQKQDNLANASFASSLRSLILKLALQSGRKYKAPEVVAVVPELASLQMLRQEWDHIRFTLEDVLTELPEHLSNKCLFKHPSVGPLSVSQTLTFLQDHFDHHLQQIHKLKLNLIK